ncbi:transcriptional regulator [Agromyces rhizosphaerae]|uniref:Transcriptional regulator n=1 Tax=Agromyces rhizosphaerae TaxID=88374 RepID=A0A9W6CW00_9MICO|nr:class I SAM-dependent methyltransferase [Agromyces rhizosphaerae]GLI27522.1 transcriptional regulator [Agromyces rhizosphaerae]
MTITEHEARVAPEPIDTESTADTVDDAAVDAFGERMFASILGAVETMAVHVGGRLGWYDALSGGAALAAPELAARTDTDARYAREWLEQQASVGILTVDDPAAPADERRYSLPAHAEPVLTDRRNLAYIAPLARMFAAASQAMPGILDAYRTGGGVSWQQFGADARESQAEGNRPWFDAMPAVLADVPHVHEALSRPDARIADVGMGLGWSSIALASAYPQLRVEGFDVDTASVVAAGENAREAGVADRVRFQATDAAELAEHGPFDAIFAFECIHDLPHPVEVLRAMRDAVRPGGSVVIMDEAVADAFAPNAGDLDRLMYGFSLFVCLPDGRSHGSSAATGTVMRPDTLRGYAREAGWSDVRVIVPEFGFWRFYELI